MGWMRLLLLPIAMGMAGIAVAWWFLMPKGFPVGHPRFWANQVLPLLVALMGVWGIGALLLGRRRAIKCFVVASASMVLAAGVATVGLYPQSTLSVLVIAAGASAVLVLLALGLCLWMLRLVSVSVPVLAVAACVGAVVGGFLLWSQRAMEPATRPYDQERLVATFAHRLHAGQAPEGHVQVSPATGGVRIGTGRVVLRVDPILTFYSRSPDRFWTLFAPTRARIGPRRSLVGTQADRSAAVWEYVDGAVSLLRVGTEDAGRVVTVEARSRLPEAVYSHLNSFCMFHLSGSTKLALSFSPCPVVVDLKPSGYPVGRPARLAFLDADHVFHVVEAASGEKGPYRTLAQGPLGEGPLEITVHVDGETAWRIAMPDWARQASTQLSPTAGWGLPENAIEFHLSRGTGGGVIHVTLAGTSVGRGWDSVGHAAGTYRNAMTIERVTAHERPRGD